MGSVIYIFGLMMMYIVVGLIYNKYAKNADDYKKHLKKTMEQGEAIRIREDD